MTDDDQPGLRWPIRLTGAILVGLQALISVVVYLGAGLDDADDVWNTVLWKEWIPFASEITVPRDTYMLHAIFNVPADLLLGPGRASLALAVAAMSMLGTILAFVSLVHLGRHLGLTGRQLVASSSAAVLAMMFASEAAVLLAARPNFRNLEIGLLLAITCLVLSAARQPIRWRFAAGTVALITVAAYNDPLAIYAVALPLLALVAMRWVFDKADGAEIRAAAVVLAGAAGWVVFTRVMSLAGVNIADYAAPQVIDLSEAPERIGRATGLLFEILGADVSGARIDAVAGMVAVVCLAARCLVVGAAWSARHRLSTSARRLAAVAPIAVLGSLAASSFAEFGASAGQNPRYLVLAIAGLGVATLIALSTPDHRVRRVAIAATIFCIVPTVAVVAARGVDVVRGDVPHTQLSSFAELADHLEAEGHTVGYSTFFVAMPVEYWARDDMSMTSVECVDGVALPGNFSDPAVFSEDSDSSVYIDWLVPGEFDCPATSLEDAWGPPSEIQRFVIPSRTEFAEFDIWIYDRNVGAQFAAD